MKSLMIIPAKSNKTLPGYFDHIIHGYTWLPDVIDYRFNDRMNPQHKNEFDYKAIESFEEHQPTEYIVLHASDVYLNPDDLLQMRVDFQHDKKAFCVGIYPMNDKWLPCYHNEPVMYCARINIWKAEIFRECLDIFNEEKKDYDIGDENTRMAVIANRLGYHAIVSQTARVSQITQDEFKNMRIG